MTAVDVASGSAAVLVQLLLAGPLIAATGATVRQTAGIAVLAVALTLPLGAASGGFGGMDHLVGTAVVAVGSLLAVVIARLRTQGERDAARLQVQYGVARALADADSFDSGAPRLLEAIARPLGRQVAQFWSMGDDERLHCVAHWHEDGMDVREFERASRALTLGRGEGLLGDAWQRGHPVWLGDALADGTLNVKPLLAKAFPLTQFDEAMEASLSGSVLKNFVIPV